MERNKTLQVAQDLPPALREQFAKDWTNSAELPTVNKAAIQAMETGAPYLGMLYNQGYRDLVMLHVTEAIATYVSMLPASRAVTAEAVIAMGKAFTDLPEVRNLTITELKTFLALAFKRQAFGKLYGGFGYDTLTDWLQAFMQDRILAIVEYRENKHQQRTAREKNSRNRQEGDAFGSPDQIGAIWSDKPTDQ